MALRVGFEQGFPGFRSVLVSAHIPTCWEEARGGRRPQPTMEDQSPDDAGQTTVRRSKRAGREEGGSRTLRRSAGGCTKRLGAAGTRGTMWKTASASPPSGGRPRLVADHTHKEPCTKTAGRGPVPFYPSPSRGVRFGALGVQSATAHPGPGSSEAHPAGRMIGIGLRAREPPITEFFPSASPPLALSNHQPDAH